MDNREFSYDEIAQVKSVNNIEKYESSDANLCIKGTPKNSRSAIVFNHLLDKHKISGVEKIKAGNKIKMVNLKKPNPVNQEVVGYVGAIPKQFDLDRFIDFEASYTSGFENPITAWCDMIGWTIKETAGFDSFF